MAAIKTFKPRKTYRIWIKELLKYMIPSENQITVFVMINDTYLVNSVKEGLRRGRGNSGQQVYVQGFDQHMLEGKQWDEFLHNGTNKV